MERNLRFNYSTLGYRHDGQKGDEMINKFMLGQIFHSFMLPRKVPVVQSIFFESPVKVFKATRKIFNGKLSTTALDLVVTYGKPNAKEKEIIKVYKKEIPFTRVAMWDAKAKKRFWLNVK